MVDRLSHNLSVYEIENLVKIYPGQTRPANQGINLQMADLIRSIAGSIRLFGQPVLPDPLNAPSYIGYMPQGGLVLTNAF